MLSHLHIDHVGWASVDDVPTFPEARHHIHARHWEHCCIEGLSLEDPRPDEMLVQFTAAGLCHTDLEVAAGNLPTPLPVVAGHEGAGVVQPAAAHTAADVAALLAD